MRYVTARVVPKRRSLKHVRHLAFLGKRERKKDSRQLAANFLYCRGVFFAGKEERMDLLRALARVESAKLAH